MKNKEILLIGILAAAIVISFVIPKPKYTSPNVLSKLNIPENISGWYSKDVSGELNLKDLRYNFISQVFARSYSDRFGRGFLLLILDAGNFHNPKVCFGGSGYKSTDLPDVKMKAGSRRFTAKAVFFESSSDSMVAIYWICVNKEVTSWTGQKLKELWHTLLGKKKSGLMIRFDIRARQAAIPNAIETAKSFVSTLADNLPAEQSEYLFGK